MKIGIITFHTVYNFGAVLQAYGLQEYLCSIGHDAYIIDYCPEYLKERYKTFSLKRILSNNGAARIKFFIREFLTYPILKSRERFFRDFLNNFLRLESFEGLDEYNDYDAFVFGSDQIWNPLICNGLDPMFFGEFAAANGKRLISYAGSMGSLKHFSDEQKHLFLKKIAPFYAISSREKEPAEFIAKGLNRPVVTVVDPVLLAGREIFEKIATKNLTEKPYLLLFTLGNNERTFNIAHKIAKEKKLKVVEIVSFQVSLKKGSVIQALSVPEFLGYIYAANFVVTSSFHGTALSVLFGKELYYVPDDSKTGERATNLLQMLGIGDRVWSSDYGNDESPIEYNSVFSTLDVERRKSADFIKSALG